MMDLFEKAVNMLYLEHMTVYKDVKTFNDKETSDIKIIAARVADILSENKTLRRFDAKYFISLHKRVFKNIVNFYPGQVNSSYKDVKRFLNSIHKRILSSGYPHDFTFAGIVNLTVDLFSEFNFMQPFEKGSGLIQQIFLMQFMSLSGYDLDFSRCSLDDMKHMRRLTGRSEFKFMRKYIIDCIDKSDIDVI